MSKLNEEGKRKLEKFVEQYLIDDNDDETLDALENLMESYANHKVEEYKKGFGKKKQMFTHQFGIKAAKKEIIVKTQNELDKIKADFDVLD